MEGRVGLPKGTLLDGSYRIERVIGSGGFGITYAAEDTRLGTKVAIKEYYPGDFGRRDDSLSVRPASEKQRPTFEWGRSSFLEEARTLARFRHPSVVQVTRVFEANSTAYMVKNFEEGASFEAWLKVIGRPPTQEELDRIVAPLLDALEMMHAESFLHRDIAPDNIIIRADGTPVLLDFGAARRAVAEMSRALTGIVKAGYSPPEQYATDSRLQGPWTDLYALGATLYRAVTGKAPEESPLRREDDRTPPATDAAPRGLYRPAFLAAVDACLNVERGKRPQSVAGLRSMLAATQTAAPIIHTRKIDGAAARQPTAKRRWRWVAAVIALVLAAGGYGGYEAARHLTETRGKSRNEAERANTERMAAEDRARQEAEGKRIADAEQTRRKADEERVAKERADAEAKRRVEEADARRRAEDSTKHKAWQPPLDRPLAAEDEPKLKPGDEFQECNHCPRMVVVPAGEFIMGSPKSEAKRRYNEGPQRKVTISKAFAVSKFEVTFAEWDACVSESICKNRPDGHDGRRGKRPVVSVSWDDATKEYLPWLLAMTGKLYRLLTEAEWEYAARAGTATPFSTGQTITTDQANFDNYIRGGDAKGSFFRRLTVDVGSFLANAFGLYDMHGNVSEWVEDCDKENYTGAPIDGSAVTSELCRSRILRGGNFLNSSGELRSAYRGGHSPDSRSDGLGLRVARNLDQLVVAEPARPVMPTPSCDGVIVAVGATETRCMKPGAGRTESFKDCPLCPEMVVVPAGSFIMGSPADEQGHHINEGPRRKVTIARPFAVSKFEVTFAEWDSCLAASGCRHRPDDKRWGRGRHPVMNVTWDDITKDFVPWLARTSGKDYRLLTEAEWEFAARAGTTTPFSTGLTITPTQANFNGSSTYGGSGKGAYRQRTVEVGTFQPNAFGLHDMHGNVWEWVQDCYAETYASAPNDGSAAMQGDCSYRVLRGGAWHLAPVDLRSASRLGGRLRDVGRNDVFGFRVARTLGP